jgi:hypothetical protein
VRLRDSRSCPPSPPASGRGSGSPRAGRFRPLCGGHPLTSHSVSADHRRVAPPDPNLVEITLSGSDTLLPRAIDRRRST